MTTEEAVIQRAGWELQLGTVNLCLLSWEGKRRAYAIQTVLCQGWTAEDLARRDRYVAEMGKAGLTPVWPEVPSRAVLRLPGGREVPIFWHPKAKGWLAPVTPDQLLGRAP